MRLVAPPDHAVGGGLDKLPGKGNHIGIVVLPRLADPISSGEFYPPPMVPYQVQQRLVTRVLESVGYGHMSHMVNDAWAR